MKSKLPAVGDIRKILESITDSQDIKDFLSYRVPRGKLKGHPFGNLLLAMMWALSKDIQYSTDIISEFLEIHNHLKK